MARPQETWPLIRPYKNKQKRITSWMVDCGMMEAKRVRFFYKTRDEAETKAALMRVKRTNEGESFFGFSASDRTDARSALDLLAPHKFTLRQAAEFLLSNIEIVKNAKEVREVVAELLASKEKNKRAARYLKDLRLKLENGFSAQFGERAIYTINAREIEDYLHALDVGGITRNNYQTALSILFRFAKKRRYSLLNPLEEIERSSVESVKPGILSLDEVRALLKAAREDFIVPVALALFSGARPEAEIWRLDWKNIDLKERTIDIEKSKNVASHRFIRISDNLFEWLKPHAKKHGPVSPTGDAYHWRLQSARKLAAEALEKANVPAANLLDWPQDCMRHMFASCHYAAFKNAGDTAEQIGHGGKLRTFFRHYRNRIKEADALAFWQISPSGANR
jgi:integrase